jgi:hypothetical protein
VRSSGRKGRVAVGDSAECLGPPAALSRIRNGRAVPVRREVQPPIPVESAEWSTAGVLDYWVREAMEWLGRVRGPDGHHVWIRASDLRQAKRTE